MERVASARILCRGLWGVGEDFALPSCSFSNGRPEGFRTNTNPTEPGIAAGLQVC